MIIIIIIIPSQENERKGYRNSRTSIEQMRARSLGGEETFSPSSSSLPPLQHPQSRRDGTRDERPSASAADRQAKAGVELGRAARRRAARRRAGVGVVGDRAVDDERLGAVDVADAGDAAVVRDGVDVVLVGVVLVAAAVRVLLAEALDRVGLVAVRSLVVVRPRSAVRVVVDAVGPDSGEDEERRGSADEEAGGDAAAGGRRACAVWGSGTAAVVRSAAVAGSSDAAAAAGAAATAAGASAAGTSARPTGRAAS